MAHVRPGLGSDGGWLRSSSRPRGVEDLPGGMASESDAGCLRHCRNHTGSLRSSELHRFHYVLRSCRPRGLRSITSSARSGQEPRLLVLQRSGWRLQQRSRQLELHAGTLESDWERNCERFSSCADDRGNRSHLRPCQLSDLRLSVGLPAGYSCCRKSVLFAFASTLCIESARLLTWSSSDRKVPCDSGVREPDTLARRGSHRPGSHLPCQIHRG
mmetsp:Transcript_63593/g.149005  ORF Transcript_63593/g.149005 Transcript_63593/m.149005 type:complete len:215 (-) Transcript_63593:237-881(-)